MNEGEGAAGKDVLPRRTFLAAALAAALAAVAGILVAKRAGRPGVATADRSAPAPGTPRLRPLTRADIYRDHDLAG